MRTLIIIGYAALLAIIALGGAPHSVAAQGGLVAITSSAQVTGAGAAVKVAASGSARWISVSAGASNAATVQCGGSNVSTTIGTPIASGGGMFFPPMPFDGRLSTSQSYYSLASVWCYVANGDTVNFVWAN